MAGYVARRCLWVVALLVLVSAVTFVIFYELPSADPAVLRAGHRADPQRIEQVRHDLGLDRSVFEQYWRYMNRLVLHADLGYSYENNADVRAQITDRLPATLSLTGGAVVIWLAVGLPIGIASALRRGTLLDRAAFGGAMLAVSAPVYWLGLLSLYAFSKDIGLLHVFDGAGTYTALTDDPLRWLGSLILPWLVLAAGFAGFYARVMRANLLEVMSEDYVRTARAKGLPERQVVLRHGVRGAAAPIVTMIGLDVGVLLGGALLVETVFNIPGVGRLAYDAIRHADLPVIQGTVLLGAVFIVLANLAVDVAYAFLDARVRYA
jgi:peptide/nickel transport system permease protein